MSLVPRYTRVGLGFVTRSDIKDLGQWMFPSVSGTAAPVVPMEPMNTVCVGNPGAGKSTILNSMLGFYQFKSGVSFGEGLTYEMDKFISGNQTFMDTPGLADIDMRKRAGEAIESALKQSGKYRIVFVVTLEGGRVTPMDAQTIATVLTACPSIGDKYAIIINKVEPDAVEALKKPENLEKVTAKLFHALGECSKKTIWVHVNPHDGDLFGKNNVVKGVSDGLKVFLDNMPRVDIPPEKVRKIDTEGYDKKAELLEKMINTLERDQAALRAQVEKDREDIRQQREELKQQLADIQQREEQQLAAMKAMEGSDRRNTVGELLEQAVPLLSAVGREAAAYAAGSSNAATGSSGTSWSGIQRERTVWERERTVSPPRRPGAGSSGSSWSGTQRQRTGRAPGASKRAA